MKRTPLTRGEPPKRTTGLTRNEPLRRRQVEAALRPKPKRKRRSITTLVRDRVRERSGGLCEARSLNLGGRCSGRANHMHHRKLRSQGGLDQKANLAHLCSNCHTWVHSNVADAVALGLIVPGYRPHPTTPWRPPRASR